MRIDNVASASGGSVSSSLLWHALWCEDGLDRTRTRFRYVRRALAPTARRLFAALCVALPAMASATFECTVRVQKVLVYGNGAVNVLHDGRGDYTVICNLNTDRQGVSPVTCAMWAAMLQNIRKNDGRANFYYSGEGTCATLPTYSAAPAPVYIGAVP
jgi:hypothetical protein